MSGGLSSPEPEDGGAVSAERVAMPAEVTADGLTGANAGVESQADGDARRAAERALAVVLDPVAYDPTVEAVTVGQLWDRQRRQAVAAAHATAAHTAGYRRLVEDDDTVRTVAESLAGSDGWTIVWPDPGQEFEDPLLRYLRVARAVVRALREET